MSRSQEFFDSLHSHQPYAPIVVNSAGEATLPKGKLSESGKRILSEGHKAGQHDLSNTGIRFKDSSELSSDDKLAVRALCPDCQKEDS
jgi:hypothetical protein